MVDGAEKQIEGYNIDGYSYFKLRDTLSAVGDYGVDFVNGDTITISTNGAEAEKISVTTPAPVNEHKYEIPVVTASSPEYSTTVDGIEMRIVNGEYCVYKDTIIKKLNDMGYRSGRFTFTSVGLYDWDNKEYIFKDVPTVDEYEQYIPLSYYYNTLLSWIQSL